MSKTARTSGSWLAGGTVTIDVDGTPCQGKVVRAPVGGDAWLVEVEDFGTLIVRAGRSVGALGES